jgi:hypothetical protein
LLHDVSTTFDVGAAALSYGKSPGQIAGESGAFISVETPNRNTVAAVDTRLWPEDAVTVEVDFVAGRTVAHLRKTPLSRTYFDGEFWVSELVG